MPDLDVALALGQSAALARMTDRCTITRAGVQSDDIDPETGLPADATATALFTDQPCRLRTESIAAARQITTGGDVVVAQRVVLSLPVDVALHVGDVATMTASKVASNVGRRLLVTGVPVGTDITAMRYEVEVITG